MRRIYIDDPIYFDNNQSNKTKEIIIKDKNYHYLFRVLRQKLGQTINLFNGDGFDYPATISEINKKDATLIISDKILNKNESNIYTTLIQAISKSDRMDLAIAKSVELGVNEIHPVITEYNAVKLDNDKKQQKHEHWQSIIISACEQCQRSTIPKLYPIKQLTEVIDNQININKNQLNLLLDPRATTTLNSLLINEITYDNATLLIGAEGGLSKTEVDYATQNGFAKIKLGNRILRTETATLAMLACLQMQLGDFK